MLNEQINECIKMLPGSGATCHFYFEIIIFALWALTPNVDCKCLKIRKQASFFLIASKLLSTVLRRVGSRRPT